MPAPKASLPTGRLHGFLVGIDNYENSKDLGMPESLKFAESDAVKISATLLAMGVAEDRIVSLITAQPRGGKLYPSAANVRKRLEESVARLAADDTLLVAFSGYELQFAKSQKFLLATADLHPTDEAKQFSLDDLYAVVGKSKCKRVVVLVDSCRGGESKKGALAPNEPPAGTSVIFACSGGQDAYEHADLGGGILTQFFVKGLRGAADADGDREVTWKELSDYVRKEVPTFAKKELKVEQLPSLFGELPAGGPKTK